jgi:hypothetical protein
LLTTASKRTIATIIGLIVTLLLAQSLYARKHSCAEVEGRDALDEAGTLRSWDALYKSYMSYRQCDDGAISEGYSESVARILVDDWKTLSRLAQLGAKDAKFRAFVLHHVDATLNMDDFEKVKKRAKTQCPNGLRTLCNGLAKQAASAQKEDASTQ